MAHGKCLRCNTLYVWGDRPRLRVAYCPQDGFPLALTSRASDLPKVYDTPKDGPPHNTKGAVLIQRLAEGRS